MVAERGAGSYVGEIALLDHRPRTATVVAKTPVAIEVIGQREFAGLLAEVPELSQQLLATVARRLADLDAEPRLSTAAAAPQLKRDPGHADPLTPGGGIPVGGPAMNRLNEAAAESDLQRALDCGELIRLYQPIVELPNRRGARLRRGAPPVGAPGPRAPHPGRVPRRRGRQRAPRAHRVVGRDRSGAPRRGVAACASRTPDHGVGQSVGRSTSRSASCRARVERLLLDNLVPGPNALAFEISERTLLSRRVQARDRLTPLRNLGVEIVVDDFGATAAATAVGPSELRDSLVELLEPLRAFPLDGVKLDPSVVDRLDGAVAEVVAAAHSIDVRVVAVGVEDEVAVERACDAGFDLAQGFFFHRPEPPSYIDGLLESR